MTDIQLEKSKFLELRRHNLAMESNEAAQLAETQRSNVAKERIQYEGLGVDRERNAIAHEKNIFERESSNDRLLLGYAELRERERSNRVREAFEREKLKQETAVELVKAKSKREETASRSLWSALRLSVYNAREPVQPSVPKIPEYRENSDMNAAETSYLTDFYNYNLRRKSNG